MFGDTLFRTAIIISVSAHLLLFAPWEALTFRSKPEIKKEPEITYFRIEPSRRNKSEAVMREIPKNYDSAQKETTHKEVKPAVTENPISTSLAKEDESSMREKKALEKLKQTEEYIHYYDLIREKIKRFIAGHYEAFGETGNVDVAFTLTRRGAVKSIYVDDTKSTKTASLRKAAVSSIKYSSPFPPFPESFNRQELTFSIAIIFKRE